MTVNPNMERTWRISKLVASVKRKCPTTTSWPTTPMARCSIISTWSGPDRRRAERRSLLIDAGAQFNGYACDITRTYAAHDGAFATLVEAVDSAQQSLCGEVRPGIDYCEFQMRAHSALAQVLRDADVIATPAAEAVESGLSRVFFPHGIGHLLGLQVHDVGGFMRDATGARIEPPATQPFLRLTRKLEPGFAVTVEPGIYFIDSLLQAARANGHAALASTGSASMSCGLTAAFAWKTMSS